MEILCSFKLVLEGKTGKETPESSRLEFKEKFSGNVFYKCVDKCILFKCGKCYKIIKSNQNGIECDCCRKWIHLRCSGLDINTFKFLGNSNQPWFCMSCTQDNIPFFSLDKKKLAKLFLN